MTFSLPLPSSLSLARANSRLTRNAEVHYEEINDIDEVDESDGIDEVSVISYKVVINHDQQE